MTRITNADQVLLLLRSHLERSTKARKSGRPDKSVRSETERRSALERVRDIAASAPLSEGDIERALVSGLLEEEFGSSLVNDLGFQDVVDKVRAAIVQDPASRQLLQQAVRQLIVQNASGK